MALLLHKILFCQFQKIVVSGSDKNWLLSGKIHIMHVVIEQLPLVIKQNIFINLEFSHIFKNTSNSIPNFKFLEQTVDEIAKEGDCFPWQTLVNIYTV